MPDLNALGMLNARLGHGLRKCVLCKELGSNLIFDVTSGAELLLHHHNTCVPQNNKM